MRSVLLIGTLAAATVLIVGACAAPSVSVAPSAATPAPFVTAASSSSPSPAPIPSPTPPPTPPATSPATSPATATPAATAPTADEFWDAALAGLEATGRMRLTVIGPSPGVLRYEPAASATVVDGQLVFICANGSAYDGQGGSFIAAPGSWTCGGPALVEGFRRTGQPVDAWSDDSPTDDAISEATALEPDGRWRWDYAGRSAIFGGAVTASVWVDPVTGRILEGRRSDPTGETTYGISYDAAFPPIAAP